MKKTSTITAAVLAALMLLSGCGGGENSGDENAKEGDKLMQTTINAVIDVEDFGEISLELYPDLAPDTVQNFVELAEDGFYDGTIFHRVIEDFMIQGGGYDEELKQKKASTIKGEFTENGFDNELTHTRGVISMARTQDPDSASSQFFIVQQDSPHLDGKYAAFGRVTEGMDVVDEIAAVRTGSAASLGMDDVPVEPVVIDSVTIENGSGDKDKDKDEDKDDEKSSSKDKKETPSPTASTAPTNKPDKSDDDEDEDVKELLEELDKMENENS